MAWAKPRRTTWQPSGPSGEPKPMPDWLQKIADENWRRHHPGQSLPRHNARQEAMEAAKEEAVHKYRERRKSYVAQMEAEVTEHAFMRGESVKSIQKQRRRSHILLHRGSIHTGNLLGSIEIADFDEHMDEHMNSEDEGGDNAAGFRPIGKAPAAATAASDSDSDADDSSTESSGYDTDELDDQRSQLRVDSSWALLEDHVTKHAKGQVRLEEAAESSRDLLRATRRRTKLATFKHRLRKNAGKRHFKSAREHQAWAAALIQTHLRRVLARKRVEKMELQMQLKRRRSINKFRRASFHGPLSDARFDKLLGGRTESQRWLRGRPSMRKLSL